MSDEPRASIIISSYNYGRYLGEAIESALNQTYARTEVIVVDDGSTDNSRSVIAAYGDRIIPLLKENGGQASAWNAGFALSSGDMICFLDSDDQLLPTAIESAVELFQKPGLVKVHWPLWTVDEHGNRTGEVIGGSPSEGNLRQLLLRSGPDGYNWPPTSGNAWSRRFIRSIFPMPEAEFKTCPDYYLATLAPLFGSIERIMEPKALWRSHGANRSLSWHVPFLDRAKIQAERIEVSLRTMGRCCRAMGIEIDPEVWKARSWWPVYLAAQEIVALIPPGETFILIDQDTWGVGEGIAGRRCIPFLERAGQYWGPPPDDEAGIQELERLRHAGARFIVFAWPHLWWLEHYRGLRDHLRSRFPCLLDNDRLVVFELGGPRGQRCVP